MITFSEFFLRTRPLLVEYNCDFAYQRRNCKKHGHYRKKTNMKLGTVDYQIAIEREDNHAAKIYTYAHELAHMINQHLDTKHLTYAQQEWVAHQVGMYFIRYFSLEKPLIKSKLSVKFDINQYANMWLKDKKVTDKRKVIMEQQVRDTIIKIRRIGMF